MAEKNIESIVAELGSRVSALEKQIIIVIGTDGKSGELAALRSALSSLNDRVVIIERRPPSATREDLSNLADGFEDELEKLRPSEVHPHRVRGMSEILKAELDSLTKDPDSAIAAKMEYGLTRDAATTAVQKRVAFLKQELGVKEKPLKKAAAVVAMIMTLGILMLFASHPVRAADQQGFPQTFTAATNLPATVLGLAQSNSINCFIRVAPGKGLGMQWQFQGAAATNAGPQTLNLSPSVDGTNIDSVHIWTWTANASGSNVVTTTTNWTRGQLDGFKAVVIVSQTNGNPTAGNTLTTNLGVLGNLPNN